MVYRLAVRAVSLAAVILIPAAAIGSELRSYQFIANDSRPYTLFCDANCISAKLSGQFDLMIDPLTNSARITRFNVVLADVVIPGTTTQVPWADGRSLLHPHIWPIDWTQFVGQIVSPNVAEFAGPGPVRYGTNPWGGLKLDYNPEDFIERLPNGTTRLIGDYQTAVQIHFAGSIAQINGLAVALGGADYSEPVIVGALAVLIPEPPAVLLAIIALLVHAGRIGRDSPLNVGLLVAGPVR